MMNIKVGKPESFSEIGQKDNQEDSLYPLPESLKRYPNLPLFLVCDGVGGLDKGEVASSTVCQAFSDYFINHDLPNRIEEAEPFFKDALSYAYNQLDRKDESLEGPKMGTTLTFAFIANNSCLAAHIGDSRIYWIRPSEKYSIRFKSNDHSLVNFLLSQGEITQEEALHHPKKNVILKAMQPNLLQRHEAEIHRLEELHPGDYLFLCSDGVLENLSEERLCQILHSSQSDRDKMKEISNICKGSYDNYTAILIPIIASSEQTEESLIEELDMNELATTGGFNEENTKEKAHNDNSNSECSETNKSSWFNKLFHF